MDEKLTITRAQLAQLKEYSGQCIARIVGCTSGDAGEVIGTGTFIDVRNTIYLLTAQHVSAQRFATNAHGDRLYDGLAHDGGPDDEMFRIRNPTLGYGFPRDIAIARLHSEDLGAPTLIPMQWDRIPKFAGNLEKDIFFVHGYPGRKSRFVRAWGGIASESFPWVATEEPCNCSWFDPKIHIAIGYPVQGQDERGHLIDLPHPEGLSGSALWKTNIASKGSNWEPEDSKIVGIIIQWDQDSQTLIATRIEYVQTLVLHVIQRESAYFRWERRGRSHGDDQADWFAAEEDISLL